MIEIEKFFSDKGFFVYNSDEISFKEAKHLFMQAKLIIGIHGAGLTNVIFAPSTCKLIELAPAKFKNKDKAADCFQELCIACNIQYLKYEFSNGVELLGILNEIYAGL
jgi:capsular polysaccharide biosynthesis protein